MFILCFILVPIMFYELYIRNFSLIFEIFYPNELPDSKSSSIVLTVVFYIFLLLALIDFLVLNFIALLIPCFLCLLCLLFWLCCIMLGLYARLVLVKRCSDCLSCDVFRTNSFVRRISDILSASSVCIFLSPSGSALAGLANDCRLGAMRLSSEASAFLVIYWYLMAT